MNRACAVLHVQLHSRASRAAGAGRRAHGRAPRRALRCGVRIAKIDRHKSLRLLAPTTIYLLYAIRLRAALMAHGHAQ